MSLEPNKTLLDTMDDAEPTADRTAAPVFFVALFALMAFLGMLYLEDHGGEFSPVVYPPYVSYADVNEHQVRDPRQDFFLAGKKIYGTTCAACHQLSGLGSAAVNAPPLAGSEWVNAEGPNRVMRIVLNGLHGPVTVHGQQFSVGIMAAWKEAYSDEQLAQVLTFIRGNKEWGNNASDITEAQVKALREKLKARTVQDAFTSDELLKIPEKD